MEDTPPTPDGVEAGVDWVTWVVPILNDDGVARDLGESLLDLQARRGLPVRKASPQGYRGWQSEGVFLGSRGDGTMLRTSGPVSSATWRRLTRASGGASRIDLQTTLWYRRSWPSCMRYTLPDIPMTPPAQGARRSGYRLYAYDGSSTGTEGSRQSRSMLRMYDKGLEAGTHAQGERWRIEGEFKGSMASRLWRALAASESATSYCSGVLSRQVTSRGGRWPLPTVPAVDTKVTPAHESSPVLDPLQWIESQVMPTMRRLGRSSNRDLLRALLERELDCRISWSSERPSPFLPHRAPET